MEAKAKTKEEEALIGRSSGKAALDHLITAVELYMKAVKEAPTQAERTRLRRKCDQLMVYGEQLKTGTAMPLEPALESLSLADTTPTSAAAESPASSSRVSRSAVNSPHMHMPMQARRLPKKEQIILLKASKLNGAIFSPWESEPTADIFKLPSPDEPLYEDDTNFSMSSQQREIFTDWKRPQELLAEILPPGNSADEPTRTDRFMLAELEPDLVQDITTDCSVVASICAISKHATNLGGHTMLLSSIMSPYDHGNGQPVCSENGKYIFKMYFNGSFRRVIVDDRLPASTQRTLFVVDRRNPFMIWPALLEKAYLKVHGGYDFPGSNSGTDLWVLTGWIPEQIFIQSNEADLDRVWKRIKGAYDRRDVMITLGTGRLSSDEEALLGLAAEHDYAVLDLKEDSNGIRQMLVKNPWCDDLVWSGLLSSTTTSAPEPVGNTAGTPMTGTFWIAFEDVIQYYESLYLNWNPSLFQYQQDHHFNWVLPSKAMAHSFAHNPQYAMQATADGPVWILLSRHFQDAELAITRHKRHSISGTDLPSPHSGPRTTGGQPAATTNSSSRAGFISLYIFATDGKRVQLSDRPRWVHRVPLVDSPQALLHFEAHRGVTYTVVVAQSELPLPSYSFTLSFYSMTGLQVGPASDPLAYQQEVSDDWSMATAGGSPASPGFVHNPQYALTLQAATPLTLLLCAEADDVPVRVDLVWARGQRVASLAVRDLVVSSGEYQRGCALAAVTPRIPASSTTSTSTSSSSSSFTTTTASGSVSSGNGSGSAGFGTGMVDAGTYTIVASTFERGQHTKFTLQVQAAVPVELQPIPAEDAGKFRTSLEPLMLSFDDENRNYDAKRGGDGENEGLQRTAVLAARLNTRISLVVQAVERRARSVYTATAAAAAAASTTAVRVSVERISSVPGSGGIDGSGGGGGGSSRSANRGGHREVIAATGQGQFQDMTVAGLRTEEVNLGRASAYLAGRSSSAVATEPQFRVVVDTQNGRPLTNVGIQVDILSTDRVQAGPWEA